jgi:hypothetical protein
MPTRLLVYPITDFDRGYVGHQEFVELLKKNKLAKGSTFIDSDNSGALYVEATVKKAGFARVGDTEISIDKIGKKHYWRIWID